MIQATERRVLSVKPAKEVFLEGRFSSPRPTRFCLGSLLPSPFVQRSSCLLPMCPRRVGVQVAMWAGSASHWLGFALLLALSKDLRLTSFARECHERCWDDSSRPKPSCCENSGM